MKEKFLHFLRKSEVSLCATMTIYCTTHFIVLTTVILTSSCQQAYVSMSLILRESKRYVIT